MSIEQGTPATQGTTQDDWQDPDSPAETPFEQQLDQQQTVSEREYERRWWTLGVLCISLVMIVMANASLNVALPTLAEDLAHRSQRPAVDRRRVRARVRGPAPHRRFAG